jgi:hypothetical protein
VSEEPKSLSPNPHVAELLQLFGPPPVLTSENARAYEAILGKVLDSLVPHDYMEQILVMEVVESTWEATRLARHKTLLMERRWRDRLKYQAQRSKVAGERKEASVNKPASETSKLSTDPEDVLELSIRSKRLDSQSGYTCVSAFKSTT